jgi:hypothetical protein
VLNQIGDFIKAIGVNTLIVLVGLSFIWIAFIDLSRSEGKLKINPRRKYQLPLAAIGGVLFLIGLGLGIFGPQAASNVEATNSIATLESSTATLEAFKAQLSTAIARAQNATSTVAFLQQELELYRASSEAPRATVAYLQNQLSTAQGSEANATATLGAMQSQLATLQADLANAQTISANLTPIVMVITATPSPPPPPPELLQTALDNAFSSAAQKLKKPVEPRELSNIFLKDARIRLDSEIGTYQNFFTEIQDPTWKVTIEDAVKEEGHEVYSLSVKQTLQFTGYYKCPGIGGENNDLFVVQYGASEVEAQDTIRAEIQQVSPGVQQVRVYSVILGDAGDQLIDSIRKSCPSSNLTPTPTPTPTSTPTPTP